MFVQRNVKSGDDARPRHEITLIILTPGTVISLAALLVG